MLCTYILQRLHEINLKKYPSNTLIDYYDAIHKLLDAIACIRGIKFKGDGAHQQIRDYICNEYFSEKEIIFIQEMRDYRNRIYYEGFVVNVMKVRESVSLRSKGRGLKRDAF